MARWRQHVDSHMHPHPRMHVRIATRCIDLIRMPVRKTSIHAVVVGMAERAVQRVADDFSLRSSRAKCIIYLWFRRLSSPRLGVSASARETCFVRYIKVSCLQTVHFVCVPNVLAKRMRERPFLLLDP